MLSTSSPIRPAPGEDSNPLSELASIFAAGLLRLQARTVPSPIDRAPNSPPDSGPTRLEVLPETVLSVSHGG
jgi:hypothetical protein